MCEVQCVDDVGDGQLLTRCFARISCWKADLALSCFGV